MSTVEPAIAHVGCWCGDVIDLPINVGVEIDGMVIAVTSTDLDIQPLWDHALEAHGPQLDEDGAA